MCRDQNRIIGGNTISIGKRVLHKKI